MRSAPRSRTATLARDHALALTLASVAAPARPAVVCSGLRGHAWRRRLVGAVPTPHRVERLGTWVDAGWAGVSFAPGADGDWARPETLFPEVPGAVGPRARSPAVDVVLRGRDSAGRDPSSDQLSASVRLEARACAPGPPAPRWACSKSFT